MAMKSWVVLLSTNVAVRCVSATVILIFMLLLLSGDFSVGGAAVGALVGGSLVGVAVSAVGVGDTTTGEDVGAGVIEGGDEGVEMGVGEQALMRTTARRMMQMRLQGLANFAFPAVPGQRYLTRHSRLFS
jgi:hypothetical protein